MKVESDAGVADTVESDDRQDTIESALREAYRRLLKSTQHERMVGKKKTDPALTERLLELRERIAFSEGLLALEREEWLAQAEFLKVLIRPRG